jgi:ABC-type dipeptide/oligopeptide/nickel transport system permease component
LIEDPFLTATVVMMLGMLISDILLVVFDPRIKLEG